MKKSLWDFSPDCWNQPNTKSSSSHTFGGARSILVIVLSNAQTTPTPSTAVKMLDTIVSPILSLTNPNLLWCKNPAGS